MLIATRISGTVRRAGARPGRFRRIPALAVAGFVLVPALGVQGAAQTAQARVSHSSATARIQALLDNPVNGVVNLPSGTFTIRPALRLKQAETIIGHHTTLKVAAHSGNYAAVMAGASPGTDLSGLTIKGVTFDQNAAGNPIANVQALYHGQPRFVILAVRGAGITIARNSFLHTNNVDTIVTGSATSQVTISGNSFAGLNAPMHDHSTVYTAGTGTTISNNTFTGSAMYDSAAIEVHGDQVGVTGNKVTGYFRAANIVSNDTTFSHNTVTGAGNPVDLWSVVAPGLHDVAVTGNVLNRDLPYWARVLARRGLPMRPPQETRQVIKDATSAFPMSQITIRGNRP
jgi:hypothetical protein